MSVQLSQDRPCRSLNPTALIGPPGFARATAWCVRISAPSRWRCCNRWLNQACTKVASRSTWACLFQWPRRLWAQPPASPPTAAWAARAPCRAATPHGFRCATIRNARRLLKTAMKWPTWCSSAWHARPTARCISAPRTARPWPRRGARGTSSPRSTHRRPWCTARPGRLTSPSPRSWQSTAPWPSPPRARPAKPSSASPRMWRRWWPTAPACKWASARCPRPCSKACARTTPWACTAACSPPRCGAWCKAAPSTTAARTSTPACASLARSTAAPRCTAPCTTTPSCSCASRATRMPRP